ncbi:hypothetical protein CMV_004295 [Castanea mollissima]|uniref:Uncharacterized protein n=1 Tax=Castanea mollissima TaxID=60419 RepID=A0A8J4RRR4_9ROSI|nr:hypothetical protein CMV_004295 [Castanea mollissima]
MGLLGGGEDALLLQGGILDSEQSECAVEHLATLLGDLQVTLLTEGAEVALHVTHLNAVGADHTLLIMSGRGHTLRTTAGGHTLLTTAGGHTQGAEPDLLTTADAGTATDLSLEACHLGQEGQGGATHAVSHPGLGGALGGATHAVFPLKEGGPPGVILEAFHLNQGAQRVDRTVVRPGMDTLEATLRVQV